MSRFTYKINTGTDEYYFSLEDDNGEVVVKSEWYKNEKDMLKTMSKLSKISAKAFNRFQKDRKAEIKAEKKRKKEEKAMAKAQAKSKKVAKAPKKGKKVKK